jgi:cytidyltransferase-like protein
MTRVYTDMVGDLFHYGHVELLRRAKELGDELLVGVVSDETAEAYKRTPVMTMEERVRVVQACRFVDGVLPDAPIRVTREWIERHRIDLVVHGDDMSADELASYYAVAQELGLFRTLRSTRGISTSDIIRRILDRADELLSH